MEKEARERILRGEAAMGLELGSTNIKAVLVDRECRVLATGNYGWENALRHGIWTYALSDVWQGIAVCYKDLKQQVKAKYDCDLKKLGAIGISGMMHGFLALEANGKQILEFRTWRNNMTRTAAKELSELFRFNIPQRWSIAHLYHALLEKEEGLERLDFMSTLAGYVHYCLSGERVLGMDDASGMFPIDAKTFQYDREMMEKFRSLPCVKGYAWDIEAVLPKPLCAGKCAGHLTEEGARLLDPAGDLLAGAFMAPPEGDGGTGMVSTNSVKAGTGNISVGTSVFSMNVLEAPLKKYHADIDVVMTPDGRPTAMVHTNNCTSDFNAWVKVFGEFAAAIGKDTPKDALYTALLGAAENAESDAGGVLNYSYLSGEHNTEVLEGRPLFVRTAKSNMNLANFILAQVYSAFASLRIGMDVLTEEEGVEISGMIAQGGLFKTERIPQQLLADFLGFPITVMETAGAGGPWGMAVLAVYAAYHPEEELPYFLEKRVFAAEKRLVCKPREERRAGAEEYLARFRAGLSVEKLAGSEIKERTGESCRKH